MNSTKAVGGIGKAVSTNWGKLVEEPLREKGTMGSYNRHHVNPALSVLVAVAFLVTAGMWARSVFKEGCSSMKHDNNRGGNHRGRVPHGCRPGNSK